MIYVELNTMINDFNSIVKIPLSNNFIPCFNKEHFLRIVFVCLFACFCFVLFLFFVCFLFCFCFVFVLFFVLLYVSSVTSYSFFIICKDSLSSSWHYNYFRLSFSFPLPLLFPLLLLLFPSSSSFSFPLVLLSLSFFFPFLSLFSSFFFNHHNFLNLVWHFLRAPLSCSRTFCFPGEDDYWKIASVALSYIAEQLFAVLGTWEQTFAGCELVLWALNCPSFPGAAERFSKWGGGGGNCWSRKWRVWGGMWPLRSWSFLKMWS